MKLSDQFTQDMIEAMAPVADKYAKRGMNFDRMHSIMVVASAPVVARAITAVRVKRAFQKNARQTNQGKAA